MNAVGIVVPCYNEAKRLQTKKFISFLENHPNFYFIFVNDGSKDETIKILNSIKNNNKERVSVLNLTANQGKAEAVRKGLLHTIQWKQFDTVGFIDADLSTPLTEITNIVNQLDNTITFVFGSRFKRIGARIERKVFRHYFGRIFATIASNMLKIPIYDTQCGAKFFNSNLINDLFTEKFISNWVFDLEIFYRLLNLNQDKDIHEIAKEVPLSNWKDIDGSKIKPKHLIKVPFNMLRLYFNYRN